MGNVPQVEMMFNKLIKPSSPTPAHLRVHKLAFLDRLKECIYAPIVFFYPSKGVVDSAETTRRIEQLEKSLSEILSFYYPLAGRFACTTDLHTVDCQDQGVLFLVKKVRTQMKDLIEKRENDFNLVDRLVPTLDVEGELVDAPLVKVQISLFECGGLTIGVNILIPLVDGFSVTKFYSDWANLMHKSKEVHVSFDMDAVFPFQVPEKLSEKVYTGPSSVPVNTKKMERILFDGSTIASLKKQVMSNGKWSLERPPSKVQVVTAVVWSGLIRAAQEKNGRQRPSMTSLSVNLRGIHIPLNLSEITIGNIYVPVPIKFFPGENQMELYNLVCLIRNSLQEKVSECSKACKDDICPIIMKALNEMEEWSKKEDEVDVVFGTSLCRFPLYDVDFGWGKPSRVSMVTLKYSVFVLMDIESRDGVEVFLNLDEPDMERSIAHIINAMHVFMGKTYPETSSIG